MSTRSTTHFVYGDESKPVAIIYRHSDGYPEGAGVDIHKFLDQCGELADSRFSDPSYLAAKYVVFLADKFNHGFRWKGKEMVSERNASKLDFLSVGIVMDDPSDIEYRYVVNCGGNGRPEVKCFKVVRDYEKGTPGDRPTTYGEVPIPLPTENHV